MNAPDPTAAPPPHVIVVAPRHAVHWVIAGLLAIIATILLLRDGGPLAGSPALAQTGMLGARGIFAFTGELDHNRYGLWMIDVDAGTIWCYEYNPVSRKMRLAAARTFRWDRYLENHNQDSPTPLEVEQLLRHQREAQNAQQNIQQGQNAVMSSSSSRPADAGTPAAGS